MLAVIVHDGLPLSFVTSNEVDQQEELSRSMKIARESVEHDESMHWRDTGRRIGD
jgi:hypothetical protein